MALTLEKIGLKNGPPNPDWYFNSPARPWNDGKPLIQNQNLDTYNKQETITKDNESYIKDKTSNNSEVYKRQYEDVSKNIPNNLFKIPVSDPLKETLDFHIKKITRDKKEFLNLHDLSRAQLKLIKVIFLLSKETLTKTTPPVEVENLSKYSNLNISTVKKTLQRLENKGFLKRVAFKNGRGGWSQYNLCNTLAKQLNTLLIKDKLNTIKPPTEDIFSLFGKATSNNNEITRRRNNTTTGNAQKNLKTRTFSIKNLPRPWCYLNTDILNVVGLTSKQIYYLFYQGKLSAAQIQTSTDFFLGEVVSERKNKNSYLIKWINFINALLNGIPYVAEKNFVFPGNINFKNFFNKEQENNFNKDLTTCEITDFLLEEWVNSLNYEEKNKLFIEKKSLKDLKQEREFLKSYFLKMCKTP